MNQEEQMIQKRLEDLAAMAYNRGIVTFTGFLSLYELHMVNSLHWKEYGVVPRPFGGYEFAERQMVAFIPDALSYDWDYPIDCIHIIHKNLRFAQALTHRDYLGALVHLGIQRTTLGDILIEEDGAYFFCHEKMTDYIMDNLIKVKNTSVRLEKVEDPGDFPTPKVKEISGSVASVRLDSILAVAFGSSRSKIVQNIEEGHVFINGRMITSNGYVPKEGDVVSLRGMGKFRYAGTTGQSRKGRCHVLIEKYI